MENMFEKYLTNFLELKNLMSYENNKILLL